MDTYAGKILSCLDALGLTEETIVVFSSDHGEMMGDHRLLAKAVPFEGASRVPLLIRAPGIAPGRIRTPVSQIDVVPTLLDLLGQPTPGHLQGASLRPLLEGGPTPGAPAADDAEVVVEWAGVPRGQSVSGYRPPPDDGSPTSEAVFEAMGAPLRTIRWGPWKLTVAGSAAGGGGSRDDGNASPAEHELYDLVADPDERHNLLGPAAPEAAPAVRQVIPLLWERLLAWQRRTADPCPLPAVPGLPTGGGRATVAGAIRER